jgi:hypothetical protein
MTHLWYNAMLIDNRLKLMQLQPGLKTIASSKTFTLPY